MVSNFYVISINTLNFNQRTIRTDDRYSFARAAHVSLEKV